MKLCKHWITRRTISLTALAVPSTLLLLAACGGGGGGGAGATGSTVVGYQMGGARQGVTLSLATASATVSTFAGQAVCTGADGAGALANFCTPYASVADGLGDLYVVDTNSQTIRKVVIATGAVTTVAGKTGVWGAADGVGTAARFSGPLGIATDGAHLYVTENNNNKIRMITPTGGATLATMTSANAVVSSLTGTANTSMGGGATDGPASGATFTGPCGIAYASGSLYVVDTYNEKIRMINLSSAMVSTVAGNGSIGAADGTGTAATFYYPAGIATDGANLYVADWWNNKIRKIAPAGGATLATINAASAVVSSLTGAANTGMGAGTTDGVASAAAFNNPAGIATDGANLYVSDGWNNKIRKIAPTGGATLATINAASAVVSSLTGAANTGMSPGFADGAASSATFYDPVGIASDASGHLFVADYVNSTIRMIAGGQVSTLAGAAPAADGTDAAARMDRSAFSTTDGINLYVTDCGFYSEVRKISLATGQVTTLAGSGTWSSVDGTGTAATFNCPGGITTDGASLYVVDQGGQTIRKITPSSGTLANMTSATAVVTTVAGQAGVVGAADGTGTAATFNSPWGLTTDGHSLFVADWWNNKIRKITPANGTLAAMTSANAAVTTVAGTGTKGAADGAGTVAMFSGTVGLTTDGVNLYVVDYNNNKIRVIKPTGGATLANISAASAVVSSLTGTANTGMGAGATDGAASVAMFNFPNGDLTTDGAHLYLADSNNNKIRMITPTSGATLATINAASAVVSSLTGTANTLMTMGFADGAASGATFNFPNAVTTDGISLYVMDVNNGTVRKIH